MTPDAKILGALRVALPGGVSGADLAQSLGISRAAIWARIQSLRELGYEIEASPHQGYRLLQVPERLHGDELMSRLVPKQIIGREVHVFEETGSTNDVIEKLGRDGVKEGVVVFAEHQTQGRGRLGRKWISPAGKGLWFSVLLRPALSPQAATRITVATATAMARAIRVVTKLEPQIKWPNDILVNGKKVCGILTELSAELDHIKWMTVGIGVDVNLTASDLPPELRKLASSLRIELGGQPVSRLDLAEAILREMDHDYQRVCQGKFSEVVEEWERQCSTVGHQVSIHVGGRMAQGRAESLDADGALLLRTQHGRLKRIIGGDVTVVKASEMKSPG